LSIQKVAQMNLNILSAVIRKRPHIFWPSVVLGPQIVNAPITDIVPRSHLVAGSDRSGERAR
jgi:hypothetical protein